LLVDRTIGRRVRFKRKATQFGLARAVGIVFVHDITGLVIQRKKNRCGTVDEPRQSTAGWMPWSSGMVSLPQTHALSAYATQAEERICWGKVVDKGELATVAVAIRVKPG
jgi:hypothetical protein